MSLTGHPTVAQGRVIAWGPPRKCPECGTRFRARSQHPRKFCSNVCRSNSHNRKQQLTSEFPFLSTGTVGAINEMRVGIDLLKKGYEVFRSMSPNCSCDLAILKDAKLTRIECRTGYKTPNGKIYTRHKHRADVLAVVTKNEICYSPPL